MMPWRNYGGKIMLFHDDNQKVIDFVGLREYAAGMVASLPIVDLASRGHRPAAEALHIGFWPFVKRFENAIDKHPLPVKDLYRKFGAAKARSVFHELALEVREMREEEDSHAQHWVADARHLGIEELGDVITSGVYRLNEAAYTEDHTEFFAMLAGTEFVAEELSRFLVSKPTFTRLFDRNRWMWGEIHLITHEEKHSHLEIDIDLARAYSYLPDRIEATVRESIRLFKAAGEDVAKHFNL